MKTFLEKRFLQNYIWKGCTCQVRWKANRPDWYQFRRPTEPHELAKEFFDGLYSKRFGKDWPAIRCALLSRKKYAAIVNNFGKLEDTEHAFLASGAVDIVRLMRKNAREMCDLINNDIEITKKDIRSLLLRKSGSPGNDRSCSETSMENPDRSRNTEDAIIGSKLSLNERLDWLTERYKMYERLSKACSELRVYAYPRKILTEFSDPLEKKSSSPVLDYFLLDGSSLLPVLALDPQPNDHILDTCSAPGGKLMCMLQLCRDGDGAIIGNDVSNKRASRIRKIIGEYIPSDSSMRDRVKVISKDMTDWESMETSVYDKVLVDVPCTTDRHSMFPTFERRDNIFSQLRKRERANLPQLQSQILTQAVKACRPGGSVVYSTCTASLQQNEYVVQMTVQQLLQNHGVSCEIEDLSPLTHLLKDHFYFFNETELGILALPYLDSNYGPTYVCKIMKTR